jgi:16S rRNA (uracil1498-N3)-methyltransferase
MSAHRIFLSAPLVSVPGGVVAAPVSDEDLHHLRTVLRVVPGEIIELVEPDGGDVIISRVLRLDGDGLVVEPTERHAARTGVRVTLVQGVAKGEKMDGIVRQAVEIGAHEVHPVITARSVVKLDARKRADRGARWRRIAKAAAEQSHQDRLPVVESPRELAEEVSALGEYDLVLVLWEESTGPGLDEVVAEVGLGPDARVAVVVGPEGGLSADEVFVLEHAGARIVSLGCGILRTETAAVVGLALTVHALGGLGARRE